MKVSRTCQEQCIREEKIKYWLTAHHTPWELLKQQSWYKSIFFFSPKKCHTNTLQVSWEQVYPGRGVQSLDMSGCTNTNTPQFPAGRSLQQYKPEPAADFDSAALHLNPQRLSASSLRAAQSLHYKDFTAESSGKNCREWTDILYALDFVFKA